MIFTLHSGAAKAFGPFDQIRFCETFLVTGEGEGESKRQSFVGNVSIVYEVGQAIRNVVKQALSGA